MSFFKRILKHKKNDSPVIPDGRNETLSSGVICMDETGDNIIIKLERDSAGSGTLPKTELRFFQNGARESFVQAADRVADHTAHRFADYTTAYPTRLLNYPSTGNSAGSLGHFTEPVDINDLKPVDISTIDDRNGDKHTTAWFVGIYDPFEGGVGPPIYHRRKSSSIPLSMVNAIIVLPRNEARVLTKFMITFTRNCLDSTAPEDYGWKYWKLQDDLRWLEDRPSS
ncbi:hypothetical protein MMC18_004503 [Xylographa bjoerkii]|nr:hypothetical protein [Xylographa bjoerkii]